jgi:tetratricopeptide (TPR) repeat protein
VRRIVWGFVGHQQGNVMRLTIQHKDRSGAAFDPRAPARTRTFERVPFSDEHPPILVYQDLLPEVLKTLGAGTAPVPAGPSIGAERALLPGSPLEMTRGAPDAVRDAHYFQLLAALTPNSADRARERFVEKSLLAILGTPPETAGHRLLKARALMEMGLRLAAIKTLGSPETAEEKHLFAVLDGNLPEAEKTATEVRTQTGALMAKLDLNAIAAAHQVGSAAKSKADADKLDLPGIWRYFAWRAMTDWDLWTQHDNTDLKRLLDQELPVAGFSLEAMLAGLASVGDPAKLETMLHLSAIDHRRRLLEAQADKWCCTPLVAHPSLLDYLDLLEGIATDNLVRRAKFLVAIQGAPEAAMEFVTRLESAYKDHPQLTAVRSRAEYDLGTRAGGAAREGYLKSAYASAANAMYWEQGQTRAAAEAFYMLARLGRSDYGFFDNLFASDIPYRPFYPTWVAGGNADFGIANARAALKNSAFDPTPVRELQRWLVQEQGQPDKFAEVLQSIGSRFHGHPDLAVMRAQADATKGDIAAAAKYYREAIAAQPGYWNAYSGLGKLLLENGEIAKAAELFAAYTGFKKGAREHPVAISNHASEAGSLFFWSGHFTQALPLYRIAADLQTGAESSLSSAVRIALMSKDYAAAVAGSLNRARRYSSPFAFRDYLGMLHAMGHSKEAWEGFNALAAQMDRPQIWESALVGHRIAGLSETQLAEWAAQESMRNAGQAHGYAAAHLLRAGVTDRVPSAELAGLIARVEREVWQLEDADRDVVRASRDQQVLLALGPNVPREGMRLAIGLFQSSKKARVKSDLVYFAEAYRAIRSGDFPSASALLQEAAKLYDMRNVQVGYLLPYLAFAATKAGQGKAVEEVLAKFAMEYQRFDYFLAKAVLAGVGGNAAEALEYLKLARYRRPFTEHRPLLSEYQFAEISEWLYESTRDGRFRGIALASARQNQTSQPWFAWAYAMEAKLASSPQDRRRAMAMAYYLDKRSERLASIPAAEIKDAVREHASRNPFLRTNAAAKRDSA